MTPAEHTRWTREWEDYVEAMERLRDRTEDEKRGLLSTLRDVRALPEGPMPTAASRRHTALCDMARECYGLRDMEPAAAEDYQAIGGTYHDRALAMLAEWEA